MAMYHGALDVRLAGKIKLISRLFMFVYVCLHWEVLNARSAGVWAGRETKRVDLCIAGILKRCNDGQRRFVTLFRLNTKVIFRYEYVAYLCTHIVHRSSTKVRFFSYSENIEKLWTLKNFEKSPPSRTRVLRHEVCVRWTYRDDRMYIFVHTWCGHEVLRLFWERYFYFT